MSFRTNIRTKKVYPISGTTRPSLDDIVAVKSPRGQREFLRFTTDRLNTIAPKSGAAESRYNGWYNWDTWNTYLILANDEQTYHWLQSWRANWQRKMNNGTYVKEAAEYAVWKYMVPSAQGKSAPVRPEVGDSRIDRSQVNYGEIVDAILEE